MNMKTMVCTAILVLTIACTKEEAKQGESAKKADNGIDIAVPLGKDDPAAREKERFDEQWRNLEIFRNVRGRRGQAAAVVNVTFLPNGTESFEGLDANAINAAPVVVPVKGDVSGPSVLKTQVYLDRLRFSVGALDGRWGRNTAIALWWYQRSREIEATEPGALDEQTFRSLAAEAGGAPALVEHTIDAEDLKGPFVTIPEDMYEKAELDCLCHESPREKLAERFHTSEELLGRLNEGADFWNLKAGDRIWVPNVRPEIKDHRPDIARIVVSIRGNTFNAFDAGGNLIFHAPTTLGSKYDPSPRETVLVKNITFDPWFHYQPTLFHEVPDDEPEAKLHPGPNSPVGVVWIALSKPHFGIHGTADPDSIGYASSHGCVRLTNWDAHEVAHRVREGVVVEFLDTRRSV
jgi:lipoprotein-anchoring transpeptidase ErfK/SrfK